MKNIQKSFILPLILTVIMLLLAGGGLAFYKSQKKLSSINNQDFAIVEENNERLSLADEAIYDTLAKGAYTLENVFIGPCGERPCDTTPDEVGWTAVENKEGGYRINLSDTILKSYFGNAEDKGTYNQMGKFGSNLYFVSGDEGAIYEVRLSEKKIVRLYQNKNFFPTQQNDMWFKDGQIITVWNKDKNDHSPEGRLVSIDLSTSPYKTRVYEYNVLDGYPDPADRQYISDWSQYINFTGDIVTAKGNSDLIWIIPNYFGNEIGLTWRYPLINLKSGEVQYKAKYEIREADTPSSMYL
ncbi:MAG: hypothetical protein V4690_00035 [Patescibacteria group bacterium]